jgi:plastocyanin
MRIRSAIFIWPFVAIGLVILLASGSLSTQALAGPAATTGVSMTSSFTFSPDPVTINVGDTVTWTNTATFDHTTTSDTGVWDSGHVTPATTFSMMFNTAGTYKYHCSIHASLVNGTWTGMIGTINVQSPTPTPTPTPLPWLPAADVNGDGVVNIADIARIGQHWLQTGSPGFIPEDVNGDGAVNIGDVSIVGQHWLQTAPTPTPTPTP